MSILRRAAVVTIAASALIAGGAAASASAAPSVPSSPASVSDGPGDYGHGRGGRPIQFGPFAIPSQGSVGFGWSTSNGGGIGGF